MCAACLVVSPSLLRTTHGSDRFADRSPLQMRAAAAAADVDLATAIHVKRRPGFEMQWLLPCKHRVKPKAIGGRKRLGGLVALPSAKGLGRYNKVDGATRCVRAPASCNLLNP
jgi:hypothetical protein